MAGIDVIDYLNADAFTRRLLDRAAARKRELDDVRDDNLATRIVNQLARSMKG